MTNFRVYNPTAPEAATGEKETEFADIREARVAILDNNKQNAKTALLAIAHELTQRYGAVLAVEGHKASASGPVTPVVLEELVASSELVLIGSAD